MLTSCGILVLHCLVQLRYCDPVWRVLESSHVKYQYKISAGVVAANWREMARTRLTQSSSKIWNHNHIGARACLGGNQVSEFLLRCFCTDSERPNIQRVADCKADKLIKCNTWFLDYLNTELTIHSIIALHCNYNIQLCHKGVLPDLL